LLTSQVRNREESINPQSNSDNFPTEGELTVADRGTRDLAKVTTQWPVKSSELLIST
jgi:hypothetical protein